MRIIGVLDIKSGVAVHARGGNRDHYLPVRSILHDGSDPVAIARAYRDKLGINTLYVADLDAIAGGTARLDVLERLAQIPLSVWIDGGVREASDAVRLFTSGASVVVAGLETLRSPYELGQLIRQFGPDRIAFSLDLREGYPLAFTWGEDLQAIVAQAVEQGVDTLIVLDLARVGSGLGVGTLELMAAIRRRFPHLRLVAGGGVSSAASLRSLADAGVEAVLVASALHNGRIGRADICSE